MDNRICWLLIVPLILIGDQLRAGKPLPQSPETKPPALTAEQLQDLTKQATAKNLQAQQAEASSDFTTARQLRKEILDTMTRHFDANDWRVVNAWVQFRAIDQIVGLSPEQQQQYKETIESSQRGTQLAKDGRYQQSLPLFQKALAIRQTLLGEDHIATLNGSVDVARNLSALQQFGEADLLYRRVLARAEKIYGPDHPNMASPWTWLALNLAGQNKEAEADPILRRALALQQKAHGEYHPNTAGSYDTLANNLNQQGKHEEAELLHRQALAIHLKTLGEEHAETASSRVFLGFNLFAQSKFEECHGQFQQALATRRKVLGEDHPDTRFVTHRLAALLAAQLRLAEAEPLARRVLAQQLKARGELDAGTVECLQLLSGIVGLQGKFIETERLMRRVLAIQLKMHGEKHPATQASARMLTSFLDMLKQPIEAEPLLRKILATTQKSHGEEHALTADACNNLAESLQRQGNQAEAEILFRRALGIRRKVSSKTDYLLGFACYNLAQQLYQREEYAEAEPLFREALAISQNVFGDKHAITGGIHLSLAGILRDRGDYARAAESAQASLRAFRSSRRSVGFSGLDRSSFHYGSLAASLAAALLARSGQPTQAWQHVEENLALSLFEDLMTRSHRRLTDEERARQDDLRMRLHQLEKQLGRSAGQSASTDAQRLDAWQREYNACQAEWGQFQAELQKKYGEDNTQGYDLPRIQKQLPRTAALVVWIDFKCSAKAKDPNGEHWACLVRSTGQPIWVRLPGSGPAGAWSKEDEKLPDRVRELLHKSKPNSDDWQALTERLHQQRVAPLQQHLDAGPNGPAITHLIVLPSAAMVGIPVEILTKTHSISYSPSGTLFAMLQDRKSTTSNRLLALGDPTFVTQKPAKPQQAGALDSLRSTRRAGSFKPLPGTRREVEAIAALFPDAIQLLGSDASEQRLDALARADRLKEFRYLHLATHGQANAEQGLHSFLAMANDRLPDPLSLPEPGQRLYDGRLTAAQMLHWQLDADLVTLSACETGLGQQQGDDYLGFAQPLLLAGSRSLVVSLWKVDDQATSLLMQRFYQNLLGRRAGLEKPLDRAAALSEAKHWLRQLSSEEVARLTRALPGETRGAEVQATEKIERARPYEHPSYWAGFILIGAPGNITQARPVLTETPAAPLLVVQPAPIPAPDEAAPMTRQWPWIAAGVVGVAGVVVLLVGVFCCWRLRRR